MKVISEMCVTGLLLLISYVASGQSSFALRNHYGVDAPVYDSLGIPLAGANYRAELWGGALPDSLTPLLDLDRGLMREIVPFGAGGYFSSNTAYLSVLAVPPGQFAWLRVRAWDARLGTTYEDVAGLGIGGYGESPLFYARGGYPMLIPATAPGALIGLQSFSLRPVVPEPSTWALLALFGTGLWWQQHSAKQKEKRDHQKRH